MSFQLNLDTEQVAHAYPTKPVFAGPDDFVSDTLQRMNEFGTGAVLVIDELPAGNSSENRTSISGRLIGIFTERDALRMLAAGESLDVPVSRHMVSEPVTVAQTKTVGEAIAKMAAGGYRHLPIVDGQGRPSGMISVAGILHYLVEHFPKIVYTLPPSPHHKTQEREGA